MTITEVHIAPRALDLYEPHVGAAEVDRVRAIAEATRARMAGHSLWNINSTAQGGGVAELLGSILAYARGAGVDVRWAAIGGPPEFFRLTKRIHNALHSSRGDGQPLGDEQRRLYEQVSADNAADLISAVQPGDVVILHDPQTAGLARPLLAHGARVIWRCHIGSEHRDPEVDSAWRFLLPYLEPVPWFVFSRAEYLPPGIDPRRTAIIPPTIDPVSAKNQPLAPGVVRAILAHVGLIEGAAGPEQPLFTRNDGSPGRVDRRVDIVRLGPAPTADTPLVVQVSRWDRLKDHLGVMHAFARCVAGGPGHPQLVLAGPNVHGVADDPEGPAVFAELLDAWRALPHGQRQHVHLANIPTADVDENAAIINALQRQAAIVVQKSLHEGFGLTVTEAMWKARPLIASRVGGIQDQIEHGISGLLLDDPRDLEGLGAAICQLIGDGELAERLGRAAAARVRERYLGFRSLIQYAELIERMG